MDPAPCTSEFPRQYRRIGAHTRLACAPPVPVRCPDPLGQLQRKARSPVELAPDPGCAIDNRLRRRSRTGPPDRDESLATLLEACRVGMSALSRSLCRARPHRPLLHGHLNLVALQPKTTLTTEDAEQNQNTRKTT